ncbi:MAG: copper resistance protein CopC [Caldilineaceae bacterium]
MSKSKPTFYIHKSHLLCAFLCVLLLLGFTGKTVQAHAAVIRAEPIDGEALTTAPSELRLWFNEPILPQFSQVQLVDAEDNVIANVQTQPQLSASGALWWPTCRRWSRASIPSCGARCPTSMAT